MASGRSALSRNVAVVLGLLSAVVAVAFLISYPGGHRREQSPSPVRTHTVSRGETLFRIAEQRLGSGHRFREIVQVNPELSATALQVGMEIRFPAR